MGVTHKPKVLLFSLPNDGHLNILKQMVRAHSDQVEFQLVLIDRKNTEPDLRDIDIVVHRLRESQHFRNTPASRVFARANALLDECLTVAAGFAPDLIVYDFPAIEGNLVGRILGIPHWSSVPGMIGPLEHKDYLHESLASAVNDRAVEAIRTRHRVDLDLAEVEVISNCLHIPGTSNLVWSDPALTPPDFMQNRNEARYRFVGYIRDPVDPVDPRRPAGPEWPLVYLSLGTEVMDNLWISQKSTREGVRRVVRRLAETWTDTELRVVFSTQGKTVLPVYPENWDVHRKVHQQRILSRASVFVTHGGSNSFHEAVLHQVPMIVIPFFGDQILVGRRVADLGLGVNLGSDDGIDKAKPKSFLTTDLADAVTRSVTDILRSPAYGRRLGGLSLPSASPLADLVGPS